MFQSESWWRFLLELLLRFPSQVSDQPLGGEGILGRHPITHHCVQEGLPLPRVETQHLGDSRGSNVSLYTQWKHYCFNTDAYRQQNTGCQMVPDESRAAHLDVASHPGQQGGQRFVFVVPQALPVWPAGVGCR